MHLGRRDLRQCAVLGREPLEGSNRNRFVEDSPPTGCLARCGADPATDGRKRVDLGGNGIGIVIAALADEADVPSRIGAGRAGGLARSAGWWHIGLDHGRPDLPGLRPAVRLPGSERVEWRYFRRLEHFPGGGRQGDPAGRRLGPLDVTLARQQRRRPIDIVEGHHHDGAFLDADRAADALPDLHRIFHHPWQRPAALVGLDTRPIRSTHVQGLHRTDVHADPAVDAICPVDLDPVPHDCLRYGLMRSASRLAARGTTRDWAGGHARSGRSAGPNGRAEWQGWLGPGRR